MDRPVEITATGPGSGPRENSELGGRKYWVTAMEAIPPGGAVKFTAVRAPSTGGTGRFIAAALALGLIGGALAFGRRPRVAGPPRRGGGTSSAQGPRETLFAELVTVKDRHRPRAKPVGRADANTSTRRRLEASTSDLAALDDQRAG